MKENPQVTTEESLLPEEDLEVTENRREYRRVEKRKERFREMGELDSNWGRNLTRVWLAVGIFALAAVLLEILGITSTALWVSPVTLVAAAFWNFFSVQAVRVRVIGLRVEMIEDTLERIEHRMTAS